MPEPRTSRKAASEEEASGQEAKQEASKVPVSRLIAESQGFLGRPSFVVAGALHGHASDEELTVDEAQSLIKDWLKKPVKEG